MHLKCAFASLYDYAKERLGYSSGAAHRRIASARALQKYPSVHEGLKSGRLTLTTASTLFGALKDLAEAQADELVEKASGKSQVEVQALVAALRPQPKVRLGLPYAPYLYDIVPIAVARPRTPDDTPAPSANMDAPRSKVENSLEKPAPAGAPVSTGARPELDSPAETVVEVVHRVQFSMTSATREKLETARGLLAGKFPTGRVRSEPLACARWRSSRSSTPFSMSGSIGTTRRGDTNVARSGETSSFRTARIRSLARSSDSDGSRTGRA